MRALDRAIAGQTFGIFPAFFFNISHSMSSLDDRGAARKFLKERIEH
jgi:hypothetical protein